MFLIIARKPSNCKVCFMGNTQIRGAGKEVPMGKLVKKTGLLCGLAFMFALIAWSCPAKAMYQPKDLALNSESFYLYNVDTGTTLFALNEHDQKQPASTVKIMTCILALENTENLDEVFVYPEYVFTELRGTGAAQADVRSGEEMTMRKALYCLMLQSDCYSALAIADRVGGGDVEKFVAMMNAKAQELGAVNTNFTNPHGLYEEGVDNDMRTTAYDLYLMAKYAIKLEGFMEFCSTPAIDLTELSPSNVAAHQAENGWRLTTTIYPMLRQQPEYYEPLKGIKTGSLPEFGFNFVSTASRNGYTYLLVSMGAKFLDEEGARIRPVPAFDDAKNLYEWAFQNFQVRTLYEKGASAGEALVNLSSKTDHVLLLASEEVAALVPVDAVFDEKDNKLPEDGTSANPDNIYRSYHLEASYDAPIKKSQKLGTMDIVFNGDILGTVDLLAAEAVDRSEMLYLLSMLKTLFSGFWVKFAVILIVLVIIFYAVLMILRNRYRKRYRRARGRRK